MNDKIIERLLEVNEKRSKEADIKFYITCGLLGFLLLVSIGGNIYQATKVTSVDLDADNNIESSITQSNG